MEFNFVEAEEVLLLQIGPNRERRPIEVKEACEAGPGHWGCTCDRAIANNADLARHVGSTHRLFWVCHEHGPESVPVKDRGGDAAERN